MRKFITKILLAAFITSCCVPPSYAQALALPAPGVMISTTPLQIPLMLKGIKVYPENPLLFDFIVDTGKSGLNVGGQEFKALSKKLIKYFLASVTIKEDDLWVNLSPYEKDRIITDELGKTELGRDMLAQDYILKQLTASMIYPEKDLGKAFWQRVYAKAQAQFGTSDIPVDTFNKVWITADKAKVLERNNVAYVVAGHLKVMLESDYTAAQQAGLVVQGASSSGGEAIAAQDLAKSIVREIILPELEKEVNEGQNFSNLRQMFYAMILASWYKRALKDALLNQVYANKSKTAGVLADDPQAKELIYAQYLEAYKKGVFDYIKSDVDPATQEHVARKYFSGGEDFSMLNHLDISHDMAQGDDVSVVGDMATVSVRVDRAESNAKRAEAGADTQAVGMQDLYDIWKGAKIEQGSDSWDSKDVSKLDSSRREAVIIGGNGVRLRLLMVPEGKNLHLSFFKQAPDEIRNKSGNGKKFWKEAPYYARTIIVDKDWMSQSGVVVLGRIVELENGGIGFMWGDRAQAMLTLADGSKVSLDHAARIVRMTLRIKSQSRTTTFTEFLKKLEFLSKPRTRQEIATFKNSEASILLLTKMGLFGPDNTVEFDALKVLANMVGHADGFGPYLRDPITADESFDQFNQMVEQYSSGTADASMKNDMKKYAQAIYGLGQMPIKTYEDADEFDAYTSIWVSDQKKQGVLQFIAIQEKDLQSRASVRRLIENINNYIDTWKSSVARGDQDQGLPILLAPAEMDLGFLKGDEGLREEFGLLLGIGHLPRESVFSRVADMQTQHREDSLRNDQMTGLPRDRSYLPKWLGIMLGRIARSNPQHSAMVAVSDNDFFSSINNVFGHLMGDEVIKATARVFQTSLRPDDYILRYGGEEFVLVFSGPQKEGARVVMKRVSDNVRAMVKNAPADSLMAKLLDKQFVWEQLNKAPKDAKLYYTLLLQLTLQNPGLSVEQLHVTYKGDIEAVIDAWFNKNMYKFSGWVVTLSVGVSLLNPMTSEEAKAVDLEKTVKEMVAKADSALTEIAKRTRDTVAISQESVAVVKVDNAALPVGGIDLNARKMGLDIEKVGPGMAMTFDPAMLLKFRSVDFTGVVPVILKVAPIQGLSDIL
ncbi:MAG: GGDEF domain-containing protein [Candidatus Omnitrophica bacterium]|nr:GGDEF domain-containing protein [Candidatus Omnitrophota bacterium]